MVILVTGFEPWGGWDRNPSGETATSLSGTRIGDCEIISTTVPVVHGEDIGRVAPLIETRRPAAVLSLGLGGGPALNVERVAVNLKAIDGENGPADLPIVEGGPAAYFATLPAQDMVARMQAAGVPARLSYSAGTFLCNHIMYSVLHHLHTRDLDIPAGFIHMPPLPEQVPADGQPSMALETIRQGITAGLEAILAFLTASKTHVA